MPKDSQRFAVSSFMSELFSLCVTAQKEASHRLTADCSLRMMSNVLLASFQGSSSVRGTFKPFWLPCCLRDTYCNFLSASWLWKHFCGVPDWKLLFWEVRTRREALWWNIRLSLSLSAASHCCYSFLLISVCGSSHCCFLSSWLNKLCLIWKKRRSCWAALWGFCGSGWENTSKMQHERCFSINA